nr:uncharacterized protein LOC116424718 [Nomia melanderi]
MDKQDFLTNLHYLPIFLFISLPSVFIVTYIIAVVLGHVEAGFPYISDAATYAPESCIFAQFINMLAMLMSFVVYIRYSQVKECTTIFSLQTSLPKWNHWALIFGLTSTFGLSVVANFQETSVLVVHFIGALLCFGGGTAYFWTQAVCTFYLHPLGCSLRLAHLRTALSIFCTVCFFVTLITGVLSHLAYKGTNPQKWYKEDGGFELHVASTVTEWICAAAFCVYLLTFTDEFRDIKISHPKARRGVGGYVNLLSHSPVNTPCPGYRYCESREALLDEVAPLVATTPPAATCDIERRTDVLCPVQIHVQDPSMRERRRQETTETEDTENRQKWGEDYPRKWIDLDENVLDGYILIDDACLEPTVAIEESQELLYPEGAAEVDDDEDDADSHGKGDISIYNRMRRGLLKRPGEESDLCTTYPLANSHGSGRDWSSHPKYGELYSHLAVKKFLEANREEMANYSVANSHGNQSVSSENRESFRDTMETDQQNWDSRPNTNYEVANSHSSYEVHLEGQAQQEEMLQTTGWPVASWREHLFNTSMPEEQKLKSANVSVADDNETMKTKTEATLESDTHAEPACDIEQCLVQIEESLLNIEQNLLHVQDLDIPELRNLLYNSPSIEKSLYDVQDLLYADGIVPVIKKKKTLSLESEDENEDDEEDDEEEQDWMERDLTIKDNDDEDDNPGVGVIDPSNELSSDTTNAEDTTQSGSANCSNADFMNGSPIVQEENSNYAAKAMNFIPNSLNKTLPRRIVLEGSKENIRLCSSGPEEPTTIDYNLNTTCAEKKLLCRDKCHNRTNSLDENSTFPNLDSADKLETGKSSLQNLLFESANGNTLDLSGKARSEEILQTSREKFLRSLNRRGMDEKRWTIMEARTEDFRKKIESIASHRRFTVAGANDPKKMRSSKESIDRGTSSREKSPSRTRRGMVSGDRSQEKDKEPGSARSFEKRKRKKISSRSQSSSENALVPSKLISLSLSLLLAALLQAVRCLTDLVEDAFKSVSYDRGGLLQ